MPDLTSLTSLFRAGGAKTQVYAAIIPQTVVHSGTLSATPTFPAQSISITTTGGSAASVRRGMTIRIETSGGVLKGLCRVATSGTISSTTLPINETSIAVVNLASGDVFKVISEYRVFDVVVGASSTLPKDSRVAVGTNTSDPPPIANAGGLYPNFVDDGQTFTTASFDASVSINVDPDSSASKTYLWDVVDGSITVGTTTTSAITATFPVGFRHIVLTVTDSTNSKSTTRLIPVWSFNDTTSLPLAVNNLQLDYSAEDGWSARAELPKASESGITTLPDGSLIVFFARQFYGNTRVSYGSNVSGRSHILGVFYLLRDSVNIDALNNTVTFEAVSPLGMLNRTPALPQLMVQSASPTQWRHVKTLSTNRMLHYLSWWHDTVSNIHDFVWQLTGSALGYRRIAVTETSSIGAQLRDIAQSINLRVTCDRLGRILFIQDYDYLSSANRALRTTIYNFTTADIREFEFTNEHRGTVKFVRGEGITDGTTAGSNRACFSNSPGNAPSPFGTGSETFSRQIVDNQTDLNARTGFHFAKVNGLYDGRFVPQGARLRLPSGYNWLDPAYNEPFTITLPSTSNKRGASFSTSTKWTAQSASLSFDAEGETIDPVYTIDHETTGQPGTTYVKPQQSQNGLPSFPPIDLAMPPPVASAPYAPLILGADTLAMFAYNTQSIVFFSNFTYPAASGGPTVTVVSIAASINSNFQSVIADPWSPRYIGTGTAVNVWLATSTRLYTITDLFGARTITQRLVFTATPTDSVVTRVLATERAVQNFVICASYYAGTVGSEGVWIARTTDGTTWSEAQLTGHYNTGVANASSQRTPTAWVSAKIPGRAYAFAFTATGSQQAATSQMYKSDDYGATWAQMSGFSNAQSLGYNIHVPWHNNDNDRYIYWTKNDTNTSMTLMRTDTTTGIATTLGLTTPAGSGKGGAWPGPISLASSDIDRRRMMVCGSRIQSNAHAVALYGSYDAGDTWTQLTDEVIATNGRYTAVRFAPNSVNALYIGGEDAQEFGYTDNFATYIDHKYDGAVQEEVIGVIGG